MCGFYISITSVACSNGKRRDKVKKLKMLALFLIFASFYHVAAAVPKVGQIIRYGNELYRVKSIDTDKKVVTVCPYYDYQHYFSYSNGWGWFYGNTCKDVSFSVFVQQTKPQQKKISQSKKNEDKILEKAVDAKYLNSLTAEEFRKLYQEVLDIAVMHPTEKAVAAYTFMTNFMRLKALVFAHSVVDYTMKNSRYYMIKNTGETSWSIRNAWRKKKEDALSLVKEHKDNIGLLAFIKGGCLFCEKQFPVLQWFRTDYGIDVLLVSMDYCPRNINLPCMVAPSTFKIFNVQNEPSMVLVIRGKSNKPVFYPVGVGLTDEATLFNRVAYYVSGYYRKTLYTDKNFMKLLEKGR